MPTPLRPGRWRAVGTVLTGVALLCGIAARFAATSALWLDEALTIHIARQPLGDIVEALRHDGHPPLFYWLLHGWIRLFGEGDVAVRALPGLFAVAALPLMWVLGNRVGGPRVARWSLLLLALSPFAARYGTEARMYSLVMLLVLVLVLTLDGLLRRPRPLNVVGLAVTSGLLLWSHYWSIYLLATVGGLLVVRWYRDPDTRATTRWAVVGLAGGGVLFTPWLPVFLDQLAHTGTPWADPPRPTVVAQTTLADLGGGGFAEALLLGTVLAILVVAAFAHSDRLPEGGGPVRPLDVRILAVVAGGTLLLGSGIALVTGGAYASRYASVVAPLILVVGAVGITRLRPSWIQVTAIAGAGALAAGALAHNVTDERTRADEVAALLATRAHPDDVVIVCPDQLGPALARALDQRDDGDAVDLVPYPGRGDPHLVDWRDYEERNDAADPEAFVRDLLERAAGSSIWLVWNGGYRTLIGQCEALAVELELARGADSAENYGGAFESANVSHYPPRIRP